MEDTYTNIRNSFRAFFKANNHDILLSSPLVPNDTTLLFTNSGMVQFKDIFTGVEQTKIKRATTIQKCIRAGGKHNDLENVGFTNRHHTFFEMLGNFSFNDYFKEGAILFAWEFLTKEIKLSKEKLYITVFSEDLEAFDIWHKLTGFGEDRIIKIKTNDNFWSMGPLGPCGPCSEIFYDYGNKVKGGLPGTKNGDGPRYTEIWNLVFMEFNQIDENNRVPLAKKGIDTGMGLERLVSVIEGKTDNYETSLFKKLIRYSKEIVGKSANEDTAYRILADHARSAAFLIADGILPGSEGRSYILRRIIRRALRHLYMIGYREAGFHLIVEEVINLMGAFYPELEDARTLIHIHVGQEEEKFMAALPNGIKFIENEISVLAKSQSFPAYKAFMLHDTFGFPLDITNDILKLKGIEEVNEEEFEKEMEIQKDKSRQSWKGSGDVMANPEIIKFASLFPETLFKGYETLKLSSVVLGVMNDFIVLKETPFYPEGGGQIGDTGLIGGQPVTECIKIKNVILHRVASVSGIKVGGEVSLEVDENSRKGTQNAHSATHILHYFLRKRLGESIMQKGSFVGVNRLRLDFSFNRPVTSLELCQLEKEINLYIASDIGVNSYVKTLAEAKKQGAIAFFGEKYGEQVRIMEIGNSVELCGGTHVSRSSQICAFKIISENGLASGIRRIEALTGASALHYMVYASSNLENLRSSFKLSKVDADFPTKVEDDVFEEVRGLQKKFLAQREFAVQVKLELALSKEGLLFKNYYIKCVNGFSAEEVKFILKSLKKKAEVIIIFSELENNYTLSITSTSKEIKANDLGKKLMEKLQGKGGGKADFASFGGIMRAFSEKELSTFI